jgi:hypothetical protein
MKPHPPTTRIYSPVPEPPTPWSSKIKELSVNGITPTEVVPDQKDAGLDALESILHDILEWYVENVSACRGTFLISNALNS